MITEYVGMDTGVHDSGEGQRHEKNQAHGYGNPVIRP